MNKRPSWDEYFLNIADLVSQRTTCLRRKVGAVIVKDKRILATGYNGAPSGLKHCSEVGCLRMQMNIPSGERTELCRAIHAEQNAVVQAAKHGVSIDESTMYTNLVPCSHCAKTMINAGMKQIVCTGFYNDKLAEDMLAEAGIEIITYQHCCICDKLFCKHTVTREVVGHPTFNVTTHTVKGIEDPTEITKINMFDLLLSTWEEETTFISSISMIAKHPAKKEMINTLGKDAIPLLIEELERGPSHCCFIALGELTGVNPIPEEHRGRVQLMAEDWIKWWKESKG